MNQTFHFHRFVLMLKLDLATKGKTYFFTALLLLVLLLAMMLPITLTRQYVGMAELLHAIAICTILFIGASFYTNYAFGTYRQSSTAINAMMIPASQFEKFLSIWLLNIIFILPIFSIFWHLHEITISYANSAITDFPKYHTIKTSERQFITGFYMLLQGFFFLGAIYFKKNSFLKTTGCFLAICTILTTIQSRLADKFTFSADNIGTYPFGPWRVWYFNETNNFFEINFPEQYQPILAFLPFVMILGLWFISYTRLQEREIR